MQLLGLPSQEVADPWTRATEILELFHTDLNGPHSTTGSNGETYFITLKDNNSKLINFFYIKTKVYECLVEYTDQVENISGKKGKKLECDNGRKYQDYSNNYWLSSRKGSKLDSCHAYVHELNGTAERLNRTIMDISGAC